MFKEKFNRDPFKYQADVVKIMSLQENRVVGMFQPTGAGKTMAIEGCVVSLGGITLFHAPTVTLAETQAKRFQNDGFDVVYLEDIHTDEDARELKDFVKQLQKGGRNMIRDQQCIVACSPSSFADDDFKWYEYFSGLARKGILKLIVIDESHLTTIHGKIFRQPQYRCFLDEFLWKLPKGKLRPQILFASATMDEQSIIELQDMCGVKITNRIHASPREMAKRDVCYHMHCRAPAHSTTMIKKLVKENGLKAEEPIKIVVSTNSKARVPKLCEHIRLAAVGTKRSDTFVVSLHGDSQSIVKKTGIKLFCGQTQEHELSPLANVMVISANTGSEGYDNDRIRYYIHEGCFTNLPMAVQEPGRNRKGGHYYVFVSLHDLLLNRYVCLQKPDNWKKLKEEQKKDLEEGGKIGLEKLLESYRFVYTPDCWHTRQENRFGHVTSEMDKSTEPCGDKCPHCNGELDDNTIAVNSDDCLRCRTTIICISNTFFGIGVGCGRSACPIRFLLGPEK